MTDTLTDRAERLLRDGRRIAVPLPELAQRLGAQPDSLARALEDDDRFLIVPSAAPLDLTQLEPAERDAYATALRAAGVNTTPSVLLAEPATAGDGSAPDAPVQLLLRESVTRLLALSPEPNLAAAAERLRTALTAAVRPACPPCGTAPSTTPPPDPAGPARVPPRRRAPSHRPPPYRGSRRG